MNAGEGNTAGRTMREVALVALPGAYLASIGALEDAVDLVSERQARVLGEAGSPEPRLRLAAMTAEPFKAGPMLAHPDLLISGAYEQMDFIWLPGFRIGAPERAAGRLRGLAPLGEWLVRQSRGGALIGASGAALLILLEYGLVSVPRVPVSVALTPLLEALYPRIGRDERQPILQQRNIYLSEGFGHDIELVARVLERLASPASSAWYRSVAGIDRAGLPDLAEDPLVSAAQLRIEQLFATGLSVSGLAADLHASHPTLIRRFKASLGITPSDYLRDQRLAAAKRLLAQTTRPVGVIARMVGFSDLRSFRELFGKHVGASPRAWRKAMVERATHHIGD